MEHHIYGGTEEEKDCLRNTIYRGGEGKKTLYTEEEKEKRHYIQRRRRKKDTIYRGGEGMGATHDCYIRGDFIGIRICVCYRKEKDCYIRNSIY
jgi:hypothetical protein